MRAAARTARTFFSLALPYFRSEDRWIAARCSPASSSSSSASSAILVAVNEWNERFFNALEARDWNAASSANSRSSASSRSPRRCRHAQYFFGQRLIIRWRRWLTERYVAIWMADGRHYRLRFVDSTRRQHPSAHRQRRADLPPAHARAGTALIGSIVTCSRSR